MAELTRDLQALGASIEFPPTPAIAERVRRRIEREPTAREWLPRRRVLAVGLAVLAIAVVGALAVPQARTAILRFFGIGAVTIERVETLPPARERGLTAGFGRPIPRAQAERRAGFHVVAPPFERGDSPRFFGALGFAAVAFEYEGRPVLLTELRGDQYGFAKKAVTDETRVQFLLVRGGEAIWIEGGPHFLRYVRPNGESAERITRLAGNVLVWRQGPLTFRLEGQLTRAEAVELAESLE